MDEHEGRLVELAGDPREQGYAQGRAFRERVPETIEALMELGLAPPWLPRSVHGSLVKGVVKAAGGFFLGRHGGFLREHAGGRHHALLEGLADGLGLSLSSTYGLNAYEIESCTVGFSLGCTSLVFPGSYTASGDPRLAYNHDFPPSFEPAMTVRRSRPLPGRGYRSISVGYAVMLGAVVGVNECGLAVSIDQAFAIDVSRLRPGLFPSMMVRECLDTCATVGEAVERIRRTRLTNGSMITLVDESGDRAVVEFSATRAQVRREEPDRVMYTFNKYRVADMERVEMPIGAVTKGLVPGVDIHAFNLSRTGRFEDLVTSRDVFDDSDILAVMSDHGGGESSGDMYTICRHDDPLAETICTVIADPCGRSVKVLFGKPCCEEPRLYRLDGHSLGLEIAAAS